MNVLKIVSLQFSQVLGVDFLGLFCCRVCLVSLICRLMSFTNFYKFSVIVSLYIYIMYVYILVQQWEALLSFCVSDDMDIRTFLNCPADP